MLADTLRGEKLIPYTLYNNGISRKNSTTRSYLPWKGKRLTTSSLLQQKYKGDGTEKSPYIINWLDDDPENPMKWKSAYKWFLTGVVGIATFAVAFASSAYTGGIRQILTELHTSPEVVTLGVSLFVLGFAVGPLPIPPIPPTPPIHQHQIHGIICGPLLTMIDEIIEITVPTGGFVTESKISPAKYVRSSIKKKYDKFVDIVR